MSILKATNRVPVCPNVGAHAGIAGIEVQAARIGSANRTTPIEAFGTNIEKRTTVVESDARHGQFE